VDFQPSFHTHLVWRALVLLPALCPVAKGKHCIFVFILKVLNDDGPRSFFSLKKASLAQQCKKGPKPSTPYVFKPYSGPPIPPSQPLADLTDVCAKKAKVYKALILATLHPPAVGSTEAPMALNTLDSPLLTLTPSSLGPRSLFALPVYKDNLQTVIPEGTPAPLPLLYTSQSLVLLTVVKDVLAISKMV
jgi:hypothetical protein